MPVTGRGWPGWPVLRGLASGGQVHIAGDVLAGVTLAALGIPEVLGYAKIAGMPVVTGLYTLLLPVADMESLPVPPTILSAPLPP